MANVANKKTPRNLPNRGPGRPKGSANKTTAQLKDAILRAATKAGDNGKGRGGLQGYCRFLAMSEPKAFAGLLGKVLPLQVTGDGGGPVGVLFKTVYEQRRD